MNLETTTVVTHSGGCHCKRVRWRVKAPRSVVAWRCNCSICSMRGNIQWIVPSSQDFDLDEESKQFISTYTFGTHTAKHTFCKVCGVTSYYTPRSNPGGVSINLGCVDSGTLEHVEIRDYDGVNWEASWVKAGLSKLGEDQKKG